MTDRFVENPIFILGSPRSGTTWLGKIFDSHPEVRYIHEPEIAFPPVDVPVFTPEGGTYAADMQRYIDWWCRSWHPRSRASVPAFAKAYATGWHGRKAFIHTARAAYHVLDQWLRLPGVWPPLTDVQNGQPVIKGVNLLGRVPALLAACPEARIIHLVRNPCAQVASVLRGSDDNIAVSALPSSTYADKVGLTRQRLERADNVERAAWKWVCFNEDVLTLDDRRIRTVPYEQIVHSTLECVSGLFAFAGLTFDDACQRFIMQERCGGGSRARYSLKRDPQAAVSGWRAELPASAQATIRKIAQPTRVGSMFDLSEVGRDDAVSW